MVIVSLLLIFSLMVMEIVAGCFFEGTCVGKKDCDKIPGCSVICKDMAGGGRGCCYSCPVPEFSPSTAIASLVGIAIIGYLVKKKIT